jgi:GTPase
MNEWPINKIKVSLVGRVNVGKSTLFNKVVEETRAIVSTVPGTTRDANSGVTKWADREFTLIDTGGWQANPKNDIDMLINKRSYEWMNESNVVVLVVDSKTGLLPEDTMIARDIQKMKKKAILVVNKSDGRNKVAMGDWYKLGLGEPVYLSATEGSGVGNFLDEVVAAIPNKKTLIVNTRTIGLIGRPNVGKSSLVNVLAGKELQVVSAEAHTTREPHPIYVNRFKDHFLFIDTAGIRKKGKRVGGIEKKGIGMSEKIARDVDINWLILEAHKELTTQDKILGDTLTGTNRGLIIVMNKWDLVKVKETNTMNKMSKVLEANFNSLKWAEIAYISAKDKKGVAGLLKLTTEIHKRQNTYVNKLKLQRLWRSFLKRHPAMRPSGHSLTPSRTPIKFLSFSQIDINPLTFQITVTKKDVIPAALLNILEKSIRKIFNLSGVPIIMAIHRLRK